jgi:hypothetical protein
LPAPSRITLGRFLEEEWLPAREASGALSPSTLEGYGWAIRSWIAPRIGGIPLQQLAAANLEGLYAGLLKDGGRRGRLLAVKPLGMCTYCSRRRSGTLPGVASCP